MRLSTFRDPFPGEDLNFPSELHTIPLCIPFPAMLSFQQCEIAPGLVIRECTDKDKALLQSVNETYLSTIHAMHTVPILPDHLSHIISVDERIYGAHVERKIALDLGTDAPHPGVSRLAIDDIFRMLVISLNLFRLFPLYDSPYFITQDNAQHSTHPHFFHSKIAWKTWQRYADPSGYDLTIAGAITGDQLISIVNILEKYYRYNNWIGNRVAVALYNFWNALFISESTLQFAALVTILETFTNLGEPSLRTPTNCGTPELAQTDAPSVRQQMNRNIPKLAPTDAHNNRVTKKRLDALYKARSTISHGSYGRDRHGNLTAHDTHVDAKFANLSIRLRQVSVHWGEGRPRAGGR